MDKELDGSGGERQAGERLGDGVGTERRGVMNPADGIESRLCTCGTTWGC